MTLSEVLLDDLHRISSDAAAKIPNYSLTGKAGHGRRLARASEGVEEFLRRIKIIANESRWSELLRRDWRYAVQLLWSSTDPIGEDQNILQHILEWVTVNSSAYGLLVAAYLQGFRVDRPGIRRTADFLRQHRERLPYLWASRHDSYHFFEPNKAPDVVANSALGMEPPYVQFWRR